MGAEDREAVERLLSLQEPDESDADFAQRIGVTPQVLSNYKNQQHALSLKSALRIHRQAGISLDWLLSGDGAPRLDREDSQDFVEGGRFVYRRLLRSLLDVMKDARRAGLISSDAARAIRDPIELHLEGGE